MIHQLLEKENLFNDHIIVFSFLLEDEPITLADKKEVILKQNVFRKILPELKIPLSADTLEEQISIMTNGRPLPFKHPGDPDENISMTSSQPSSSRVPNLWPFE